MHLIMMVYHACSMRKLALAQMEDEFYAKLMEMRKAYGEAQKRRESIESREGKEAEDGSELANNVASSVDELSQIYQMEMKLIQRLESVYRPKNSVHPADNSLSPTSHTNLNELAKAANSLTAQRTPAALPVSQQGLYGLSPSESCDSLHADLVLSPMSQNTAGGV